jgi:colicin import membrane protein
MEREAEARRVVEEQRQSEAREAEARAAEERGLLEAKREEEARQLAEKLNRSRAEREAASRAPDRIAGQPERTLIGPPSPLGRSTLESKATVLLVMTPGKRGIRRFEATADPVLCVGMHCYIGAGAGRAARKLPRLAALGPANTLGARAGACRTRLGCIFRGVDLGSAGAELQPVDLRIMRHDRRETQRVAHDSDCGLVGGDLMCRDPIRSATWRAWIVPESLAAAAGPQTLARALASGLPEDRWAAGR